MGRARTALSKARRRAAAVDSRRSDYWESSDDGMHCSRCGAWLHWGSRRCDRWTASGVVLIAGFMLLVGLVAGVLLGSVG